MKYCKPRAYEYTGLNGTSTETQYVTFNDIAAFHGKEFSNKWKEFANLKESTFGSDKGYYYYDYKRYALTTNMWIEAS